MTSSIKSIIEQDLKLWRKDENAFPREMNSKTLEVIKEDEDAEPWMVRDADRELCIREHGFAITAIHPDGEVTKDTRPDFTYTIGLDRLDLPEMLSYYPSASSVHHVFWKIYRQMLDGKLKPPTDVSEVVLVEDVFENKDLKIALTLTSPEETEWLYEETTCQMTSNKTPIVLVHVPYPNGQMDLSLLPEELLNGFAE